MREIKNCGLSQVITDSRDPATRRGDQKRRRLSAGFDREGEGRGVFARARADGAAARKCREIGARAEGGGMIGLAADDGESERAAVPIRRQKNVAKTTLAVSIRLSHSRRMARAFEGGRR